MHTFRFKSCRLLLGNVWKRELTLKQRHLLSKLRSTKRSTKKRIYPRENRNSYIKLQTTRKLPLFYGHLPITKMHRRRKLTSYIPFLLNPEARLDVVLVRLYFCETLPQARQPISHRKVCVNSGIVNISHFKVSHGDIISFIENDAFTRKKEREIRSFFYIKILVGKIIGKSRPRPAKKDKQEDKQEDKEPFHILKKKKETEWLRILEKRRACRLLLKSPFLQKLNSSMQEKDLERTTKFRYKKICLGSSFAERNRMHMNLSHSVTLPFLPLSHSSTLPFLFSKKRRNEKSINLTTLTSSSIDSNIEDIDLDYNYRYRYWIHCSAPSYQFSMKGRPALKTKGVELPTHYSEVNHRTLKAVVFYGPNIDHIPHDIRLKDLNLLLRSGKGRGQNI